MKKNPTAKDVQAAWAATQALYADWSDASERYATAQAAWATHLRVARDARRAGVPSALPLAEVGNAVIAAFQEHERARLQCDLATFAWDVRRLVYELGPVAAPAPDEVPQP